MDIKGLLPIKQEVLTLKSCLVYGGYTGIVPPVPIPNTEVKYTKADDSGFAAKVGSSRKLGVIFYLVPRTIRPRGDTGFTLDNKTHIIELYYG